MSAGVVLLLVLAWFALALLLGWIIGRVIDQRDERDDV